MKIKGLLLIGLLLLLSGVAQAQDCPAGQYQAAPPDARTSICAPIPRGKDGQPVTPPAPATHWGAIATEEYVSEHVGTVVDKPTKGDAEQAALAECTANGGKKCKIQISYGNGCAALLANDDGYQAYADVTLDHAVQTGTQTCNAAGHGACRVVYSGCSPRQSGP